MNNDISLNYRLTNTNQFYNFDGDDSDASAVEIVGSLSKKRLPEFKRAQTPSLPKMLRVTKALTAEDNSLWRAANELDWDQVKELLENPDVDVNLAPTEGDEKGQSVLWIAANMGEWEIVAQMLQLSSVNLNASAEDVMDRQKSVVSYLLQAKLRKIIYYCIFKFDNIVIPNSCSDDEKNFFNRIHERAESVSAKIVPFFFDDKKWERAQSRMYLMELNRLPNDLKRLLCAKAILAELKLLSLEKFPDLYPILYVWIDFQTERYQETRIQKENDIIRKVGFYKFRCNQDMSRRKKGDYVKLQITECVLMIK